MTAISIQSEKDTSPIQRFAPDAYFTQAQYDRMKELLDRRASLSIEENNELDALIDAELDATIARTDSWVRRSLPWGNTVYR